MNTDNMDKMMEELAADLEPELEAEGQDTVEVVAAIEASAQQSETEDAETTTESEETAETPEDVKSDKKAASYRCKYPTNSILSLTGTIPDRVRARKHIHTALMVSALESMETVELGTLWQLIEDTVETEEQKKQWNICGFKGHVNYFVKSCKGAVELTIG